MFFRVNILTFSDRSCVSHKIRRRGCWHERKQRGETVAGTNFPRIQKGSLLSSFPLPSFNFGLTLTNPLLCISPSPLLLLLLCKVWIGRHSVSPILNIRRGKCAHCEKLIYEAGVFVMSKVVPFRNGRNGFFFLTISWHYAPTSKNWGHRWLGMAFWMGRQCTIGTKSMSCRVWFG